MKPSIGVLVSSAGRRVELMNCFREDARALGLPLRIYGVDLNPSMSAACLSADASFRVPRCTADAFLPRLLGVCTAEGVHLVVPTIDTELMPLANAKASFADQGIRIAISSPEVVTMARDKLATMRHLAIAGVPVPRTVPLGRLVQGVENLRFPIILKPGGGSSSIGLHSVSDSDALKRIKVDPEAYLAQEAWTGREYTVNMFFDSHGQLRSVVPHLRQETRTGEVSKGKTERVEVLMDIADRIGGCLPGARGALCFQAIVRDDGQACVFEINARFGGGYPLAHRAGGRFSQWLLEETLGLPCSATREFKEGVQMLRYDSSVFIEPSMA